MTSDDFAVLCVYVDARSKDLGLSGNWEIEVSDEPCDEDATADVHVNTNRNKATIRFCPGFRGIAPEEQRETVVHELVHIGLRESEQYVPTVIGPALSAETRAVVGAGFDVAFERGVDWVSRVLARHLPLIEWLPKAKKKASKKRA